MDKFNDLFTTTVLGLICIACLVFVFLGVYHTLTHWEEFPMVMKAIVAGPLVMLVGYWVGRVVRSF